MLIEPIQVFKNSFDFCDSPLDSIGQSSYRHFVTTNVLSLKVVNA